MSETAYVNGIPEMTAKMGRHWKQPDRAEVDFREGAAFMSAETFEKLSDYSLSQPTGLYAGKMWKSFHYGINVWFLSWVVEYPSSSEKVDIYSRAITVICEADPVTDSLPVWML